MTHRAIPILTSLIFGAACASSGSSSSSSSSSGSTEFSLRLAAQHRPSAVVCPSPRPAGNPQRPRPAMPDAGAADAGDAGMGPEEMPDRNTSCYADSDCTQGKEGRCYFGIENIPSGTRLPELQRCTYAACMQDSDCGGTNVCGCDASYGNACIASGCRVDADCKDNLGCSPSAAGYRCHTKLDECIDNSDCQKRGLDICELKSGETKWTCGKVVPLAGAHPELSRVLQ
jgi:hypothetical protein